MKLILLLCLMGLLNIQVCLGYTPTLESLLRNGNNTDIGMNTVYANLSVIEVDPESNTALKDLEGNISKKFLKLLIYNEREESPVLVQLNYNDGGLSANLMAKYFQRSFTTSKSLGVLDEQVDANFFYSLMGMLLNNKSSFLIDFLKGNHQFVKNNNDLINNKKLRLLSEYKRYLIAKKDDEELELENPFKPTDEEKVSEVKEVQAASFLEKDNIVKKVKVEDDFFWLVEHEGLYLKFGSDHRIIELRVQTRLGKLEAVFGKFIPRESKLEFQEFIWFKDGTGKKYEIKATKFSMFKDNKDMLNKRIKRYQKTIEKNEITDFSLFPNFIL